MKYKHLYIGIPCTWDIRVDLVEFLLEIQKAGATIDMHIAFGIDNNRNIIAHRFLESDCRDLLWIDSDIGPAANCERILDSDLDIITGLYPIIGKTGEVTTNVYKKWSDFTEICGIDEIDRCWFGFIKTSRKVIKAVTDKHGWVCQFQFKPDGRMKRGEDYNFCDRAKDLGFSVKVDTRVLCKHYKKYDISPHIS